MKKFILRYFVQTLMLLSVVECALLLHFKMTKDGFEAASFSLFMYFVLIFLICAFVFLPRGKKALK